MDAEQRQLVDTIVTMIAGLDEAQRVEALVACRARYVGSVRAAYPDIADGEIEANWCGLLGHVAVRLVAIDNGGGGREGRA